MMSPRVTPGAQLDAPLLGLGGFAAGHRPLDFDRRLQGVDHPGELDQEALAGGLDDAPPELGDQGIEDLVAQRLEAGQGARLVRPHEPAVADHVGGDDRRKSALVALFALFALCGHGAFPRWNGSLSSGSLGEAGRGV